MTTAPLPGDQTSGRQRLSRRALSYWRVSGLLWSVPVVGAAVTGAVLLPWPWAWLRWAVAVGLLIHLFVIETLVAPPIRHRTFWYAVSADEIDLQHGFLITTRVVIPMNRVQHLKLEHGPLADRFGVANLEIHTAAGAVPLPAIDATEADALRRRIGELAGLADDV